MIYVLIICRLCFFNNPNFSKIKDRMIFVKDKYRVSTMVIKRRYRQALRLKNYFDRRCGCNIYRLLGIN